MIRCSRKKRRKPSPCTWIRRSTPLCSVSMRRRPFRPWIASTRSCLRFPAVWRSTALNTFATALSLYAALDVKTGKVQGKTTARHTSTEFIGFLTEIVAKTAAAKEIHIVLDNLSAHKTLAVKDFLENNPRVRFHFTPTYSSWLNQVQILVCQNRTRCHRSRRLHVRQGPLTQTHEIHPPLCKIRHALPLDLHYGQSQNSKEMTGTTH